MGATSSSSGGTPSASRSNGRRGDASGAPASQYGQQQQQQAQQNATPPANWQQEATPPTGDTNSPATNRVNLPSNKNDRSVQEGQMINMLATIEASTVSYDADKHILRFFITSTCPALTYEIHTGVKELVGQGIVYYMPNKPKVEPNQFPMKGPQDNREVAVKLDISCLEERERKYDKHYPRQIPCAIVIRYQTTELKPNEKTGELEERVVEHAEHTAVDLFPNPRRRVISQIVTAGNSSYVVENLFGVDGDNNNEVTVGSTVSQNNGGNPEDDEDILCVICLTNLKDTSCLPCRHMCLCKDCGEQLLKHKPVCPVCRAPISTLLHKPK